MKNTADSKNQSSNTLTDQKENRLTYDYCIGCVWLNKQPKGLKSLCIIPGNCFWDKDKATNGKEI